MTDRPKQGDIVKVERDEKRYPSRGTWPRFRGKIGTVVIADNNGEVGVAFKPVRQDPAAKGGQVRQGADTTWFMPYELTVLDPMVARALGVHPDDP